jgi:CMP-N,N'-diacetyllegionaminic acid synthase
MMKIIAIIHARGGSKRIPLKNIKFLKGKPLIAYPIELAKSISKIDRVLVSTDHKKIIDEAKKYGAETPFIRPSDISEDVASELVTEHALIWLKKNENYQADIVITLTPATPFTKKQDLENALELLIKNKELDSVITVSTAKEYPQWVVDIDKNGLGNTPFGKGFDGEYNTSQNLKKYFYPLGAFFINRVVSFLKRPSMYGDKWGCYKMDVNSNIDIDEPEDFEAAKKMTFF